MTHVAHVADDRLHGIMARYGDLGGRPLLEAMIRQVFPGRLAVVSSFGTESAVLLHLVAGIDPSTPVIFLDTDKLFGETRRYRRDLVARLGLTDVRDVTPDADDVAREDPKRALWAADGNRCCTLRKVRPLGRALEGFDGWVTGRKAYQGGSRARLPLLEPDGSRLKINPLAMWRREDIAAYFDHHGLPPHPLEADGYPSVGCLPCTTRVAPGENVRAGRWRGSDKTECGIHMPLRSS